MMTSRPVWIALLVGAVGLVGLIVLTLTRGTVMPSYFAAWLICMALPLGALPLVMLLECCDAPRDLIAPLRMMLMLLPLGLLGAVPVMVAAEALFQSDAASPWLAPGWIVVRMVVILVVLSLLALLFGTEPNRHPRRGLALFGLGVHVVLVSLAAIDWLLALQPALGSSAIGLLLILSQACAAACAAALLMARRRMIPSGVGPGIALLLAGWGFLHFIQYLVVWSANLPAEVVWYQTRLAGAGEICVALSVVVGVIALVLLTGRFSQIPSVLVGLAGAVLVVHLGEGWWLVTPAFRGRFTIAPADVMAMLALGGLAAAMLLGWQGRPVDDGG